MLFCAAVAFADEPALRKTCCRCRRRIHTSAGTQHAFAAVIAGVLLEEHAAIAITGRAIISPFSLCSVAFQ